MPLDIPRLRDPSRNRPEPLESGHGGAFRLRGNTFRSRKLAGRRPARLQPGGRADVVPGAPKARCEGFSVRENRLPRRYLVWVK
jgi:hypothetical protein